MKGRTKSPEVQLRGGDVFSVFKDVLECNVRIWVYVHNPFDAKLVRLLCT